MFSIETVQDIELLKELTNMNKSSHIKELEEEISRLSEENSRLREISQRNEKVLNEIGKNLVTAEQCREIVFDLLANKSKPKNLSKSRKLSVVKSDTDEFDLTNSMKKTFNKILVEGNTLIHYTVKNQRMKIPISTVELLALLEVYQHRKRKFLNKDAEQICKLYNINKVQFGKLYHNLEQGIFFKAIEEIDSQIKRTNFKIKNGFIYIIDGGKLIDTKIDIKTYNYLVSVFANSNQPYSTIYKLSVEYSNINPIYLLTVLKRNAAISNILK